MRHDNMSYIRVLISP